MVLDGLSPELVERIKSLKLEFTNVPQPELLIAIPNLSQESQKMVEHSTNEFTSLCPLNTAQPDYAAIQISLLPRGMLVELKSLKFYLVSFRMVPIFHEEVPSTILKDLVKLLDPKFLLVVGDFGIRGGLTTRVSAQHGVLE